MYVVGKRNMPESYVHMNYTSQMKKYVGVFPPEMREWAGLGKAASQVVKVSLAEHAVFEEGQLSEEHLRHLSQ